MARPREFDVDDVLDRVVAVFWQRGYRQTSIQDLLDATGLKRGSLYAAFGNKQALFNQAMARYCEELQATATAPADPEALLRRWFKAMLERSAQANPPRGCLMLNSMAELQHLDEAEREGVLAQKARLEGLFAHCVAWSHERSGRAISLELAEKKARSLVATLLGLSILSRGGEELGGLMDIAEGALDSALGLGPGGGLEGRASS